MDTITAILNILFILWIIAVILSARRKPKVSEVKQELAREEEIGVTPQPVQGETLEVKLPQGGKTRVYPKRIEKQKEQKIPRGKFPAFVDKLSEKELFARLHAALKGRPEEVIKIASAGFHGGETFWLSGHNSPSLLWRDKDFTYSDDGTDLSPITVYYN